MSRETQAIIEQGLQNLQADSMDEVGTSEPRSKRELVLEEVDAVYEESDVISEFLPRAHCHVYLADFKSLHGQCQYNKREPNGSTSVNHHVIRIARAIVNDEHDWRDTVRHELAHAVAYEKYDGSQKHNRNWKRVARQLGATPESCADTSHKDPNYYYGCPNGCWKSGKVKRSGKIQRPGRYHCQPCEEDCVSWEVGDERPTEPGTCAVDCSDL